MTRSANSKHQASRKPQPPGVNPKPSLFNLGADWILTFGVYLEIEAWNLEFLQPVNPAERLPDTKTDLFGHWSFDIGP